MSDNDEYISDPSSEDAEEEGFSPNMDDEDESAEEEEDEEFVEEEEEEWPRFRGSNYVYQKYIRSEKVLQESLQGLENSDLSVHLYNTHALKRLARRENLKDCTDYGRKSRWHDEQKGWHPPRTWAKWPLEPGRVPRASILGTKELEEPEGKTWVQKSKFPEKPSSTLEDLILSEILKKARQRFRKRRFNDAALKNPRASKRARVDEQGALATPPSPQADANESEANDNHTSHSEPDSNAGRSDLQSQDANSDKSEDESDGESFRPTILTDEEKARRLATPSIRHLLTQLETLLYALHQSRKNNYPRPHKGRSSTLGEHDSTPEERDIDRAGDQVGNNAHYISKARQAPQTTARRGTPMSHLGARDWSEVVGTAAMIGLNPHVTNRVLERCQDLFGETMNFQVLHENPPKENVDDRNKDFDVPADHYLKSVPKLSYKLWMKRRGGIRIGNATTTGITMRNEGEGTTSAPG